MERDGLGKVKDAMHEATPDHKESLPSLAALVLQGRRYQRLALYATVLAAVMLTLNYALLIWPIFQPHDLSNSRVQQFLLSDEFRATTAPMFKQMERYNARSGGESIEFPSEFYAGSGSMSGLVVVVHYRVVRGGRDAATANAVSQVVYVPDIQIRLDQRCLFVYLALMVVLCLSIHAASRLPPEPQRRLEERLLEHAYTPVPPSSGADGDRAGRLMRLLQRFHVFAKQLAIRHASRPAMAFNDEYDVQDALHALLKLHYLQIRPEEYTPSYAGSSSRIDFLLDDEAIAVEVKMTRRSLRDREIANELIIDIARYRSHRGCRHLVCLVYDPAGLLENPDVLKKDLESSSSGIRVSVVISPAA